jgi:4,5-DOPA dioxygenase extradiol
MPTIFLAHGAPPLLDDSAWLGELHAWAHALPRPTAILMISAHWEERPLAIGATETVPLIYDFYGFPDRYYRTKYASPGAPLLAARVRELLRAHDVAMSEAPRRGLDHGAFVPLIGMYPQADVPVLQIALPSLDPGSLFALGQALAPLRDEGVLIIGSGFLTHNLRSFGEPTPAWAREFDDWVAAALTAHDNDALMDFAQRGPAAKIALPTHEHFVPLLVAAGAAPHDAVRFPITGFWMGSSFTKRSVQLG